MLSVAQTILKNSKPLSTYDFSPTLLLAVVSATEKYLPAAQHRKLFDKVYQLFLAHHKVSLPYRIPVKIPLLTPTLKIRLSSVVHGVIDKHTEWPSHLRTYLNHRVQLIRAKTSTVSKCLLTDPLRQLSTSTVASDTSGPCPCHAWAHLPNVHAYVGRPYCLSGSLCLA